MKNIKIHLSALTRLEWSAVVAVPDTVDPSEYDKIVDDFYDLIDGGDYSEDAHYWEKGSCYHRVVNDAVKPTYSVDEDGDIWELFYEGNDD